MIYEQFLVTGTDDSVENYTNLFTIVLRNDDIQEFDSKWDGILLSMTKIPHDDILEGLYKLRIRQFEKLKTVLELYDLETHQMKLGPDYHILKAMVKRSIEQEIRMSGQCTHKHPSALSNLIDPFSGHTFVSPHLHARDHHSNALALPQVSEK